MKTRFKAPAGNWFAALAAFAALVLWPYFVSGRVSQVRAAALPTMAPVVADYTTRDKYVAFWEKAVAEHHSGDMISPRQLSSQYLQRYREHGDIGDVLRAEHAAQLALKAQPHYIPGDMELAASYLTLHRFHDAMRVLKTAEREDPGDPGLEIREASLQMELGDYEAARRILARQKPSKFGDISADTIQSRLLELTGHLAEARTVLERAGAQQNSAFDAPAQARAWFFFRQGEMAWEAGDTDTAIALERRSLDVFPLYAEAFRALARFELALHRWPDALADATRAADLVPYPETLGYKADAQRALGDTAGAAQTEDLIRTIERIGNTQRVSDRLLAIYYSEHNTQLDDAYRIARRELAVRDDIYTEDTLAWAAAMDGRWDEARRAARKALRYDTEDSRLQYHAGAIALHFGDRAEAKRRLQRALDLNPHFHPTYADDARAQLARL